MNKIMIIFIVILCLLAGAYTGLTFLAQPTQPSLKLRRGKPFIASSSEAVSIDLTKPKVLLTCLAGGLGGAEIHMLVFYAMLKKNGYSSHMLVPVDSALDHYLTQHHIAHYTTRIDRISSFRPLYNLLLGWCLQTLCKKEKITIINCNNRSEVAAALSTKKNHPTHVVFTRHVPDPFAINKMKNIDAIIAVSPYIIPYLESENRTQNLGIGNIGYIPPFFDADSFLAYIPTESRQDFFKNNFGIDIKPYPVITMIANFYQDLTHKNHPLLFDAIKILIQKSKPVTVMLAGNGGRRAYLENLAKELGLAQYIHFLGFTDKTPGLLYHSDVFVLSSSKEASPLVYREAGLMKKPAIGATGTGAEAILLDEQTGLLFKNNDAQDLANKIERLLDNPTWAQELGNNAHEHIKKNFSPEAAFTQYKELYETLQR